MKDNQNRRAGQNDKYTVIGIRQAIAALESEGVYAIHGGKHSKGGKPPAKKRRRKK